MTREKLEKALDEMREKLHKEYCIFPYSTHEADDYRIEYFDIGFDANKEIILELAEALKEYARTCPWNEPDCNCKPNKAAQALSKLHALVGEK